MKEIELEIVPENPPRSYGHGDTVRGKVRVAVHEEWLGDGIELILGLKGSANVNEGVNKYRRTHRVDLAKKTLYQGRWTVDIYIYPFEIEVPTGPFTYQGKIISLTWILGAEARTSKGECVRAESELTVVPGTDIPEGELQKTSKEVVYKETPKSSMGCLMGSLLFFLVGAFATVWTFRSGKDSLLGFAGFGAVLGLIFIVINVYMMMNKRIGMAEARIGSGIVSPGEAVPCSLIFQVNKAIELNGIYVTLTCRERAGNVGIRASKKTYQKVLSENRLELSLPAKQVPANVPIESRGELLIPPNAPLSFLQMDSLGNGIELRWDVEFRISMNRWPDWFYAEKITVQRGNIS